MARSSLLARVSLLWAALGLAACAANGDDPGLAGAGSDAGPRTRSADARAGDGRVDPQPTADAGSPTTSPELCDGLDNDGNGLIDEGSCPCAANETQRCYVGVASQAGQGSCRFGTQTCIVEGEFGTWGPCTGSGSPEIETCNGVDDDCDGSVDEELGGEPCGGSVGVCRPGTSACVNGAIVCEGSVAPGMEICGNGIDEDCDGHDASCGCAPVTITLNISGDCVTTACPAATPYPVGCHVHFDGGDPRGCVASSPTNSTVYFQEGNACGAGHVTGTMQCSACPGTGLNASNCPIDKPEPSYPRDRSGCAPTS